MTQLSKRQFSSMFEDLLVLRLVLNFSKMNLSLLILLLSAMLFAIGFACAVSRPHASIVLIGIDSCSNAANLNFIAFCALAQPPGAHGPYVWWYFFNRKWPQPNCGWVGSNHLDLSPPNKRPNVTRSIHEVRKRRTPNVDEEL